MIKVDLKWLVIGAIILIGVLIIGTKIIGNRSQDARQADAGRAGAEAMQDAGQAAVETVIEQSETEIALDDLVEQAAKEIRNAETPEEARAATLSAACELQLYRDDPACRVRPTDTP